MTVKLNRYCDICAALNKQVPAIYDAKTTMGPWAYVCEEHFKLDCYTHPSMSTRIDGE